MRQRGRLREFFAVLSQLSPPAPRRPIGPGSLGSPADRGGVAVGELAAFAWGSTDLVRPAGDQTGRRCSLRLAPQAW
jgi:hypothetical protein